MQKKSETGQQPWIDPDDAPPLTEEMLSRAEMFEGNTHVRRGRGRPKSGNAKEQISIRIDKDVLEKLREAGPGWQSQVNSTLREALGLDTLPSPATAELLPDEEISAVQDELTKSRTIPLVHDAAKMQTPARVSDEERLP